MSEVTLLMNARPERKVPLSASLAVTPHLASDFSCRLVIQMDAIPGWFQVQLAAVNALKWMQSLTMA